MLRLSQVIMTVAALLVVMPAGCNTDSEDDDGDVSKINVLGEVFYDGYEQGRILVFASSSQDHDGDLGWVSISAPGEYSITLFADQGNTYFSAFNDLNGDFLPSEGEAFGEHEGNPVKVGSKNIAGINIVLAAP